MRVQTLFAMTTLGLITFALIGGPATAAPARVTYAVTADVVRGAQEPVGVVCATTTVFKRGEEVVWRARVLDTATGEDPGSVGRTPAAIEERGLRVVAYLENGQNFPMRYGQHPGRPQPGDYSTWFWATGWKIPADFPTGRIKWWIVVQDRTGATVRFDPIGVGMNVPAPYLTIEAR